MLAADSSSKGIDAFGFFDMAMPQQPNSMINYPQSAYLFICCFLISLNKDINHSAFTLTKALFYLLRLGCFAQELPNLGRREYSSVAKSKQHSNEQIKYPSNFIQKRFILTIM